MRARPRDTLPTGMATGDRPGGRPWRAIGAIAGIGSLAVVLAVLILIVATRPPAVTGTAALESPGPASRPAASAPAASTASAPAASTASTMTAPAARAMPTAGAAVRPTPAPRLTQPAGHVDDLPRGDAAPAHPTPSPAAVASVSPAPPAARTRRTREPEELTGYDWPLYRGRMTSYFGSRAEGFLVVDGQRIHSGLDTTTWCGDKVKAAHKGVVLAAGRRWAHEAGFRGSLDAFHARLERRGDMRLLPIAVIIDDGNGYRSMYVHLSKATVKVGQQVRKGQVIGIEGMTGNATGCHVHYELIRMDGPWMRVASELVREYRYPRWQRERVDPLRVLDMRQKRAGRKVPGIERPDLPASLRAPDPKDD